MTGFRLPITAVRKLNVWLALCEKFPSNKLCTSWKRYISSGQQLATINYKKYFSISPVKLYAFIRPSLECTSLLSVRSKSNSSSGKKKQTMQQEEEEDEDEEDEDEGKSDSEEEFEDDVTIEKNHKDLEKVVSCLRYDIIMKAGLDVARNKVEDAFYRNELRLNGEKLWKKSRTVKAGDTLDLLLGEDKETEAMVVTRVVLRKVSEKTGNEKYKVLLRRWRRLKVPKQDVLK
ncbi:uncharacterized protein C6orf203 homolog isoform X1 [Alligator sinensis]|uniref:Uncharacterized protein C6orf203 homolog isoform X1 n=1 Tax=Alligator sinensis TaxID=38654 RepID=A0A1U7R9S5_ALLSI|nr:uncharacterized protein C6orf203 homolog isoform X1 [Alligator sinensis]